MHQNSIKMENLLKFISEHADSDVSRLILDRKKYQDIDIELAVNCIESRRKLKGKVHEWYGNGRLIFPLKLSAEQCSSSATGHYKSELAARIADSERWTIADLTGGLGVDSWFFSQKAAKVIYNEMQPVLCEAAVHNFHVLGADNIKVINSTVTAEGCLSSLLMDEESYPDIIYMDPARRGEGGKKVFLIEECSPDVLTIKDELFKYTRHILIKLSPMADITMVCERLGCTCREVHVISSGGECKELLIWMDREWHDEYTVMAVEIDSESATSTFIFKPSEEKSAVFINAQQVDGYLFEPGKSLMKSSPFNLISQRFNIEKLGISTHYYIVKDDETVHSLKTYGKVYKILECLPLDKRSMKDIGRRYPKSEVTARNIPMDTDTLRKKTGVTSGDDAHIFGLRSDSIGNLLLATARTF